MRRLNRAALVDRIADDVEDAAERAGADRHGDRGAGIADFLAADETVRRVHRDGAHGVLAQFLRHFQHKGAVADLRRQRVVDIGQFAFELHVHDSAQNLRDATDRIVCHFRILLCALLKRLPRRR